MTEDTTEMETVEYLCGLMIEIAEERGSFTHPDVIEISQRLDVLVTQIQRKRFDEYQESKEASVSSFLAESQIPSGTSFPFTRLNPVLNTALLLVTSRMVWQ